MSPTSSGGGFGAGDGGRPLRGLQGEQRQTQVQRGAGIGKTLYYDMTRYELLEALQRLGELIPQEAQIVIAGGAALILGDYVERGTADGDVVHSSPSLAHLRSAIIQVAQEKGLSPHWLNDGVKAFTHVLPDDFQQRTERMGTFGNLRVFLLGRMDLIVSKFYGGREVDFEDLDAMRPTDTEIEFVLAQLDRIARFRPDKALKMQLYLEQGAGDDVLEDWPPVVGDGEGPRDDSRFGGTRGGS